MKFKLDENLGTRGVEMLRKDGHDVETVVDESLTSASDRLVLDTCAREQRCLVTLDLGFANPLVYPPADYAGIVVLRIPVNPLLQDVHDAIATLAIHVSTADVTGRLWIVQRGRIREYIPDSDT